MTFRGCCFRYGWSGGSSREVENYCGGTSEIGNIKAKSSILISKELQWESEMKRDAELES